MKSALSRSIDSESLSSLRQLIDLSKEPPDKTDQAADALTALYLKARIARDSEKASAILVKTMGLRRKIGGQSEARV